LITESLANLNMKKHIKWLMTHKLYRSPEFKTYYDCIPIFFNSLMIKLSISSSKLGPSPTK